MFGLDSPALRRALLRAKLTRPIKTAAVCHTENDVANNSGAHASKYQQVFLSNLTLNKLFPKVSEYRRVAAESRERNNQKANEKPIPLSNSEPPAST